MNKTKTAKPIPEQHFDDAEVLAQAAAKAAAGCGQPANINSFAPARSILSRLTDEVERTEASIRLVQDELEFHERQVVATQASLQACLFFHEQARAKLAKHLGL